MKRSREEQIMLDALQSTGCEAGADIKKAVSDGLRQIRRERYEERVAKKESYKSQKRNYYYFCKRNAESST